MSKLLLDHYSHNWQGKSPEQIYETLGLKTAEEMYDKCLSEGDLPDEAWLKVYSAECYAHKKAVLFG